MSAKDRLPKPVHAGESATVRERASATSARPVRTSGQKGSTSGKAAPRGLRDVQIWMVGAITGSEADAENAEAVVTAGPLLSARERLEIYRSGYRSRLVECLLDDYPVLAQTLGEERFESLCHAYMDRHPSSSPSLNAFGRHMPAFAKSREGTFASELAAIEWALVEVLHAATPPALDLAALQAIPVEAWAGARLPKSDAVRLLTFEHPVNAYYQACRVGERPEVPLPAASATVVYRQELTLWRLDLTPAMTRVLSALLGGETIGEALSRMGVGDRRKSLRDDDDADALAEAERSVMVWFREWVSAGFFQRVDL
jgi:hypothetical protein